MEPEKTEEQKPQDVHTEVTCPHCKGKFFHRIGSTLKTVAETAIEVPLEILMAGKGGS